MAEWVPVDPDCDTGEMKAYLVFPQNINISTESNMFAIFKTIRKSPRALYHLSAIGLGVTMATTYAAKVLITDPTLVLNEKKSNPYPWIHLPQETNLKLYKVNQRSESGVRKSYILDTISEEL